MGEPRDVAGLVEHFFRREHARLLAALVRRLGAERLHLAEEAVQDALLAALRTWPLTGVPEQPGAWLHTTARNQALDALRREASMRDKLPNLARSAAPVQAEDDLDEQLAMTFMCCHPALGPAEQVALTLQCVAGFSAAEVARAFFAGEAAIAQRLVRAKRRIAESRVPVEMPPPDELPGRLDAVLEVLYLWFNEGYTPREREEPLREDLVDEAIRVCGLLASHPAGDVPRTHALLALMWFQSSRMRARIDADGALVPIEEQDRGLWDRLRITQGALELQRAGRGSELTEYHLLAGIASCHTMPRTNWRRIASLYDELAQDRPTFVVRLNRAVAVGRAEGPAAGLALLDALGEERPLARNHLWHAARADCLHRLGRVEEARSAYTLALDAAPTEPERIYLRRRVNE